MDRQATRVLAALKALAPEKVEHASHEQWLAGFRYQTALIRAFSGPSLPLAAVEMSMLGGVPVRIFRPAEATAPVLFHIHGGGGVAGTLDGHDPTLRRLAARTGWTVVAPDYDLAPRQRCPALLEQCYAALVALAATEQRIVVSGDSIGGTLATTLAVLARDRSGPTLLGQLLFYPNTDLRHDARYPSRDSEDGNIIAAADLDRQIDLYLGNAIARTDPLASPILQPVLADLPPVLIFTCENDPLRDEGAAYADRLRGGGVDVEHHCLPGMIHACLQMAGEIDAVDPLLTIVKSWLDQR